MTIFNFDYQHVKFFSEEKYFGFPSVPEVSSGINAVMKWQFDEGKGEMRKSVTRTFEN